MIAPRIAPRIAFRIARREALGGALGGIAALLAPGMARAAALPVPPANRLGFDVMMGSRKLGSHELVFHPQGDGLLVDVVVDLAYRIGPMTLFRYTHTARERWTGGQIAELTTQTNENGTHYKVDARRENGAFVVQPPGHPSYAAPADALPATHWNRRELDGPLINTQNGELLRPQIAPEGLSSVAAADGKPLRVRKYALSGPVKLNLWYDEAQQWAGLSFVKGGFEVRYARQG
ncbi:DUF6134 family protein [Novosphingobium sp.]|uniref:DUF6134 family protein n=1 Tax=Novosphingobium sp. TaxID=1874826 RepID=UPI003D0AD3C2